jgi:membrane associated rhomboid family serine protease
MHLIFNIIALWSFGVAIEYYFSLLSNTPGIHFYMMYFVAIVLSSVSDLVKRKNDPGYLSLGASGAVSAVIFSAIFFDPWNLIYIFFIPCPGIIFGALYLVYSSYASKKGGGRINHDAHFYGSVFGFLYPLLMEPSTFRIIFLDRLLHPSF